MPGISPTSSAQRIEAGRVAAKPGSREAPDISSSQTKRGPQSGAEVCVLSNMMLGLRESLPFVDKTKGSMKLCPSVGSLPRLWGTTESEACSIYR